MALEDWKWEAKPHPDESDDAYVGWAAEHAADPSVRRDCQERWHEAYCLEYEVYRRSQGTTKRLGSLVDSDDESSEVERRRRPRGTRAASRPSEVQSARRSRVGTARSTARARNQVTESESSAGDGSGSDSNSSSGGEFDSSAKERPLRTASKRAAAQRKLLLDSHGGGLSDSESSESENENEGDSDSEWHGTDEDTGTSSQRPRLRNRSRNSLGEVSKRIEEQQAGSEAEDSEAEDSEADSPSPIVDAPQQEQQSTVTTDPQSPEQSASRLTSPNLAASGLPAPPQSTLLASTVATNDSAAQTSQGKAIKPLSPARPATQTAMSSSADSLTSRASESTPGKRRRTKQARQVSPGQDAKKRRTL